MNPPLFWKPEFNALNIDSHRIFEMMLPGSELQASIPFEITGNLLRSPGIGTFGGFYSSDENSDWKVAWENLVILNPDIAEYEVIFPPAYFLPRVFENQVQVCVNLFNATVVTDTNQHVLVSDFSVGKLSKGNRKKLRQFHEASGKVFRCPEGKLEEVIDVLEISRENLGVQLSMSRDQIRNAFNQMPHDYDYYTAEIQGKVVASAITVSLTADVKYVLYWGDIGDAWRSTSPIVALYLNILQDSRARGFSILDLGISSVEGTINEGLMRFKKNLGATTSSRHKVKFRRPRNLA